MTTVAAPTRADLTRFPVYIFARETKHRSGSPAYKADDPERAYEIINSLSSDYRLDDITVVNCEDCRPVAISLG